MEERKPLMKPGRTLLSQIKFEDNHINPQDLKNWFATKPSILVSTKPLITPGMDAKTAMFLIQNQNQNALLLEDSYLLKNPRFDIENGKLEFDLDEGITIPEGYYVQVNFYRLMKESPKPVFRSAAYESEPPVQIGIFPYVYLVKESESNEPD